MGDGGRVGREGGSVAQHSGCLVAGLGVFHKNCRFTGVYTGRGCATLTSFSSLAMLQLIQTASPDHVSKKAVVPEGGWRSQLAGRHNGRDWGLDDLPEGGLPEATRPWAVLCELGGCRFRSRSQGFN